MRLDKISKENIFQIVRFFITGIISTILNTITIIIINESLKQYTIPHMAALSNGAGFLVASSFAFQGHSRWSFKKEISSKKYIKYILIASISFLLTLILAETIEELGYSYQTGIIIVIITITPVNFLLHKFWTYR
jgi:putative flippase GtrA